MTDQAIRKVQEIADHDDSDDEESSDSSPNQDSRAHVRKHLFEAAAGAPPQPARASVETAFAIHVDMGDALDALTLFGATKASQPAAAVTKRLLTSLATLGSNSDSADTIQLAQVRHALIAHGDAIKSLAVEERGRTDNFYLLLPLVLLHAARPAHPHHHGIAHDRQMLLARATAEKK